MIGCIVSWNHRVGVGYDTVAYKGKIMDKIRKDGDDWYIIKRIDVNGFEIGERHNKACRVKPFDIIEILKDVFS